MSTTATLYPSKQGIIAVYIADKGERIYAMAVPDERYYTNQDPDVAETLRTVSIGRPYSSFDDTIQLMINAEGSHRAMVSSRPAPQLENTPLAKHIVNVSLQIAADHGWQPGVETNQPRLFDQIFPDLNGTQVASDFYNGRHKWA